MSALAINTKYIQDLDGIVLKQKGKFFITSKLPNLEIHKGDSVVFLKPESKDDFKFSDYGKISKELKTTRISPIKSDEPTKYQHHYSYELSGSLKRNNLLSDLEYSLSSVYRHTNAKIHFSQQVRIIDENDYETIKKGWIYISRTIFGKFVNALPRQNRFEFMLQAMANFNTIDFSEQSVSEGLNFLLEYIETRILSRGHILVETNNIIKSKLSDLVDFKEIGFIDTNTDKSNLLHTQAERFEQLFDFDKTFNSKSYINKLISEHQDVELRFRKIFEKQTWPVNLSI